MKFGVVTAVVGAVSWRLTYHEIRILHENHAGIDCWHILCSWLADCRIVAKMKSNQPKFLIYRQISRNGTVWWYGEHPHGGRTGYSTFNDARLWCLAMICSMQREKTK